MTRDTVLVTGAAGFIGFHLCQRLLREGVSVVGLDNLNDYYDPALKKARLEILEQSADFTFYHFDIANTQDMETLFGRHRFQSVIHLAAQAGVRYSLENPHAYVDANVKGFLNILEGCRKILPQHIIYASSSSVYGGNRKTPFSVKDNVDHPVSLYAATKKSNELMAHTYSHLFNIPVSGLRFFTVYGEWGRPDMAYFKFTKALFEGTPIHVYNHGDMERDFTYIDDIVEGIVRLIPNPPSPNPDYHQSDLACDQSWSPYRVYNIGNHNKERLMTMIEILEDLTGKKAVKQFMPMQAGDVQSTWADVTELQQAVGFSPDTPLSKGLEKFVRWYRQYYN
jgi:UDP-glucuronate 4-epimerase